MMTRRIVAERLIYFSLFLMLAASFALSLKRNAWSNLWQIYSHTYFLLLLAYTWFIFILLFIGDYRKKKPLAQPNYRLAQPKIAVVIPCYNEPAELLYKAIRSVI